MYELLEQGLDCWTYPWLTPSQKFDIAWWLQTTRFIKLRQDTIKKEGKEVEASVKVLPENPEEDS